MLKRTICLLLILIIFPCSSFAEDIVIRQDVMREIIPLSGAKHEEIAIPVKKTSNSIRLMSNTSFEDYIVERLSDPDTLPTQIKDLSSFNMTSEEFRNAYNYVVMKHPELFARTAYRYYYDENSGIVHTIEPRYVVSSREDAQKALSDMKAVVKEYTDLAAEYDTDIEKLLVIHDKMVADCVYDVSVLSNDTVDDAPETVYHALGVFRDRFAVCQGYSQALYMIAKELDIEMDFCVSDEKKHMWNYVKLDGKWYHMDMTNDDPLEKDATGKLIARTDTTAWHGFFLCSDAGLDNDIHGTSWRRYEGKNYVCNDTKYEANHLFNLNMPFTAEKSADGYYHVPYNWNNEILGVSTEVEFVSEKLYTGPVISQYVIADRHYTVNENGASVTKTERNLYLLSYPTKALDSTRLIMRRDSDNVIVTGLQNNLTPHTILITRAAQALAENIEIEYSAFRLNPKSLVPLSYKTVWSQ